MRVYNPQEKIQGPLVDISLDMPKGLNDISFIVHHITLGLWNQEMQNFLRMT